jgi:hypothetical protein
MSDITYPADSGPIPPLAGALKRLRDMGDDTYAEVLSLPGTLPGAWTAPGTAWDVRTCSDVEVQFVGTPGTAYQPISNFNNTKKLEKV